MAEEQKTHTHVLEDGTVVEHSHGEHGHHHSHAHTKAVLNRMSRAIGHMESIKPPTTDMPTIWLWQVHQRTKHISGFPVSANAFH